MMIVFHSVARENNQKSCCHKTVIANQCAVDIIHHMLLAWMQMISFPYILIINHISTPLHSSATGTRLQSILAVHSPGRAKFRRIRLKLHVLYPAPIPGLGGGYSCCASGHCSCLIPATSAVKLRPRTFAVASMNFNVKDSTSLADLNDNRTSTGSLLNYELRLYVLMINTH